MLQSTTAASPLEDPEQEVVPGRRKRTWRDYLHWLIRRCWIVVVTGIGGFLLGQYVFSATPPVYRSWAVIEVERVDEQEGEVNKEERLQIGAQAEIFSMTQKFQLPEVYTKVAEALLKEGRDDLLPERPVLLPWKEEVAQSSASLDASSLAAQISTWVNVSWRESTSLIDIYVQHTNRGIAQMVANGILTSYSGLVTDRISKGTDFSLEYLNKGAEDAKREILATEAILNLYQESLATKLDIRSAEAEIVDMDKRYLPKWPALIEARLKLESHQKRFLSEVARFRRALEAEAPESPAASGVAKAPPPLALIEHQFWENAEQRLEGLENDAQIQELLSLVESRSSLLAKDIEMQRSRYEARSSEFEDGKFARDYSTDEFTIVQKPTLPASPFAPNRSEIVRSYAFGGIGLGLAIIFLIGFIDPSVRTVTDLESLFSVEIIGAIPQIGADGAITNRTLSKRKTPSVVPQETGAAEAIRNLRAGLSFLGHKQDRKSFMFTSSIPGEGKSWISANLAVAFAQQGDRTLLIDLDLRKPMQHQIFEVDRDNGVSDYLSGAKTLKEALRRTKTEHLFLMTAGSKSSNPSELLNTRNLDHLMEATGKHFDRIIIDTAPILAVRDALAPAKLVHSVVVVFQMGRTPAKAMERTLQILASNQTSPVGIIANRLPRTRSKGAYGYYYSYYQTEGYYGGYGEKELPRDPAPVAPDRNGKPGKKPLLSSPDS